jgi:hypothetical protein
MKNLFRTVVNIAQSKNKIDYDSILLLLGSCFTDSIGQRLNKYKFKAFSNPFGTLYNPTSIYNSLQILLQNKLFTDKDLHYHNNLYFSFYHHSSFSHTSKNKSLEMINHHITESSQALQNANFLFISFGTAYAYQHNELNTIVSNCHKLPQNIFNRVLLKPSQIINNYKRIILNIKEINPKLIIIFTVSPIRHWKDGAVNNQLSKSILINAIHEIISNTDNTAYFPSYELVMDDLRDYRFYTKDMLHLNEQAIDYIWDKFAESYFSSHTNNIINQIGKIISAINHKPFHPNTKVYDTFLKNQHKNAIHLQNQHNINLNNEIDFFKNKIDAINADNN